MMKRVRMAIVLCTCMSILLPASARGEHATGGGIAIQPLGGECANGVGNPECFAFILFGCTSHLARRRGTTASIVDVSDVAASTERARTYEAIGIPTGPPALAFTYVAFRDVFCAPIVQASVNNIPLGTKGAVIVPRSARWMIVTAHRSRDVEWTLTP